MPGDDDDDLTLDPISLEARDPSRCRHEAVT